MTNVARLPGPIADIWDWQRMGLCRGRDSAQFFHPDGERGASRGRREATAKQLCRSCPVRAECAAHALATREPYGVWGGFTEAERLRLLATGWEDTADRQQARVDIGRLEARLGLRPSPPRPVTPVASSNRRPTNSHGHGSAREQVPGRAQPPGRGQAPGHDQMPGRGQLPGHSQIPGRGQAPTGRPPSLTPPAQRPAAAAAAPNNAATVLAQRGVVIPGPRSGLTPRPAVAR
jgi:WhiB family redox-sensing transcriptional regulator